jgi:hypothetical protein
MKKEQKQEIINSLQNKISELIKNGVKYCSIQDIEYSYSTDGEENNYTLEIYSQYNSKFPEDGVACKWLKDNGYMIKNSNRQIPEYRPNKWIIRMPNREYNLKQLVKLKELNEKL